MIAKADRGRIMVIVHKDTLKQKQLNFYKQKPNNPVKQRSHGII